MSGGSTRITTEVAPVRVRPGAAGSGVTSEVAPVRVRPDAAGSGITSEAPVGVQPGAVVPYRAAFALSWRGRPAGEASEELSARPAASGYRFVRWERWRVARGGEAVEWETDVVIHTDADLRGERVAFYRDRRLRGSATRSPSGWLIEVATDGEEGAERATPRRVPGDVEPAELVRLRLARRRDARWAGRVLLAGFDFAVAHLAVEPDGDARRVVLSGPAGRQETRMWLRADGSIERADGPDVSENRRDTGRADGDPPDLVELGAIQVSGRSAAAIELARGQGADRLARPRAAVWLLDGRPGAGAGWAALSIPDPVPGPALRALADHLVEAAGAERPIDQLRALARGVAELEDDLSRGTIATASEVLAAGRADCVGHAALFSALTRARGFEIRLVTGYRLEGSRLVRHMWTLVRVDGAVIPIDPTTGDAPIAPGRHLALAAHGSAPSEIALAAELAFAGLSGARARFVAR